MGPHYNSWADFKKSGGVESQSVVKVESESIPGGWAFQPCARAASSSAIVGVIVTVDIKPDRVDDFIKAMQDDTTKSHDPALDPGCKRFDLLRDRDSPNKFVFYEAY